jgi:hypothetical protein
MPVKQRQAKVRANRITTDAVAAFSIGDHMGLQRALGLKPWQPSPFDIDGPAPPVWATGTAWAASWDAVADLRKELETALQDDL